MVMEFGVVGQVEGQLEWRSLAACIGVDQSVFFVDQGGSSKPAKAICAGCCVRLECLAYAVNEGLDVGIWGGLTSADRARIGRRIGARTKPFSPWTPGRRPSKDRPDRIEVEGGPSREDLDDLDLELQGVHTG